MRLSRRLRCIATLPSRLPAWIATVAPPACSSQRVRRRARQPMSRPRRRRMCSHASQRRGARRPILSITYTLLLKESPEFVRFINPGDLRIAQETCGQCHAKEVTQVRASLHTTTGVFWTAAAYNNGIWPFKTPTFLGKATIVMGSHNPLR